MKVFAKNVWPEWQVTDADLVRHQERARDRRTSDKREWKREAREALTRDSDTD